MPSSETKPRPRGRPETRVVKLDAEPEEVARRIFANAKTPDPSKRITKKRKRRGRENA